MYMLTFLSLAMLSSAASALDDPQLSMTPANDTAVVVQIVTGEASCGSVVEYDLFFSSGGKDRLLDLVEVSCCKNVDGACQRWQDHAELTCHGISIGVDYHFFAVGHEVSSEGNVSHTVMYPKAVVGGTISGDQDKTVTLTAEEWQQVQNQALTVLLDNDLEYIQEQVHDLDEKEASYDHQNNSHDSRAHHYWRFWKRPLLVVAPIALIALVVIAIVRCKSRRQENQLYFDDAVRDRAQGIAYTQL